MEKALAYLAGLRDSLGNFGWTHAIIWTVRALLLAASEGKQRSAAEAVSLQVLETPASI